MLPTLISQLLVEFAVKIQLNTHHTLSINTKLLIYFRDSLKNFFFTLQRTEIDFTLNFSVCKFFKYSNKILIKEKSN